VQTARDREIVEWIGRLGAAGAEHVVGRFGMSRSPVYARLASLVADGLLEQRRLPYREPGLYVATAEGLRWCGLERLGLHRVSPGSFEHSRRIASTAAALHLGLPRWRVLSEREVRAEEADTGELMASVKLGDLPGGRQALHRPDLALVSPEGRVVAVEVELSVKAARRLQAICRGYARARHLDRVYYLTTRAAARAVERVVAHVRAEDRVMVLALEDTAALVDAELEEASRVGT
jgi:hypothetical protein